MSDEQTVAEVAEAHHAGAGEHFSVWEVFGYLCILTLASFVTLFMEGSWGPVTNMLFVLLVAVCKAALVLGFFMHLRYEGMWRWFVTLPASALAIILVFALLPDIAYQINTQIAWPYSLMTVVK
ncbi:hypothetical protein Pan216_39680 [Planctomycetes bacterium Pan216]|uniref:Cytochrome C oxidase subunit IV n=1 Tax=Kolteria novifilia TaxID=2527975 RepID=A0A518B813_9BACT|nr:hypothetical protein Pan216_39680 [Planctomycetes bacterium Pan216]